MGSSPSSVEKPVLSMSEESKASQVEWRDHIGDLLRCEGIVQQEFVPPGRTIGLLPGVLQHLMDKSVHNVRIYGGTRTVWCTRKCPVAQCMVGEQLLVAKSWVWCHTFLTRIMWRLVISPVSENEICTTRVPFPRIPWASEPVTTRRLLKSFSAGFLVAWAQKGTTVKGTTTNGNNENRTFRYGRCVGTFGYALICVSFKISNSPVLLIMRCYAARDHTILTTVTTCTRRCVNLCTVVEYDCQILWA
jgi:hypothetical protein